MSESPGSDFYKACNSSWLRKTSLPAYRNTYSVSEELEEYLETYLFQIAHTATGIARKGAKSRSQAARAEDAIGRLVMSSIRPEKQGANIEYLKRKLRSLGCIHSAEHIAQSLGSMIQDGVPTLLDISVDTTFIDGRYTRILQIEPGSLGLPDPRYYLTKEGPERALHSAKILREYRDLLDFVDREFDLGISLSSAISTEVELADPLLLAQDETELFIVSMPEVLNKFPAIPWNVLFEALGIEHPPKQIAILSVKWLSIVNAFFERLSMAQWISLLATHVAVYGIQFLPAPFDSRHFELFGRRLLGQTQKIPQQILTMNVLRTTMSEYMSYFFIRRFLDPKLKTHAVSFVETIMAAAERRLRATPWLESASREKLAKKLRAMRRSIFYPEPVEPPTNIPDLQTDKFLENIYLLNRTNFARDLERLKNPHGGVKDWKEAVYTVNAYYYPEINEIVLPAGYFFWPFYDSERLGWSYGGLGAIIAHEIIHAFDEDGKEINEKGEHRPLWSKKDERAYEQRLSSIVALYNRAKVGGIHVNGAATASENLADLGGVAIALDALEAKLANHPKAERLRELREFFWSYATSWRTKTREKKALQDIFVDKHAPPEIRVNYVVAQFDAWYEAFGIVTGDDMYIPPEERLRIF